MAAAGLHCCFDVVVKVIYVRTHQSNRLVIQLRTVSISDNFILYIIDTTIEDT